MAAFRRGRVTEILEERDDLVRVTVALDDFEVEAVGFPSMLPALAPDDRVVVNTTGLELGLGTGGVGFILWNLDGDGQWGPGDGHIVKLRYTPWQTEVRAVEAQDSPHHRALSAAESLDSTPVVSCTLHSQLAGAAAGIKAAAPHARVGYLMTDGAALPMAWSRLVARLQNEHLVDVTCTAGHALGGELESVNVWSGLMALKIVGKADVIVAAMGPGVVGTATALGFTAMEQGHILDAAAALQGQGIAALRISFADPRPRHAGVSHHSLTALRLGAREHCVVVLPQLPGPRMAQVRAQLEAAGINRRHHIVVTDGAPGLELLAERGVKPTSMGRGVEDTPELFLAASAAGAVAAASL